jgi:hypothetical protein
MRDFRNAKEPIMAAKGREGAASCTWRRWGLLAGLLIITAGAVTSCSDSSTEPQPADDSSLQLDKLLVSMVPGGVETVTVLAKTGGGAPLDITIDNDAPEVVTATLADSVLTVTGSTLGTAHITIESAAGKTRVLPVQVYSAHVLDAGDMYVTYTDLFRYAGFNAYEPVPPEGYHFLGHVCAMEYAAGNLAVPVVRAKPGSDALRVTHDFTGPGHPYANAWEPVAPAGYVALGTLFGPWFVRPDSVYCVREDLTTTARLETLIGTLHVVSPADYLLHYYAIGMPDAGPHPGAFLTAGTFVNTVNYATPAFDNPAAHILDVALPTLEVAADQVVEPRLTGYEMPPESTVPTMARAVLVPCALVADPRFAANMPWRVANSPFYRLERQVYYKRIYFNHNNTSTEQTHSVLIRSGITATESQRVWSETKISVTAKLGLNLKVLTGQISCTVSHSLGYETQSSIAELEEKEVSTSINTPPYKAAAAWQLYNRYVLYRHNGTEREPVSQWEFGIDSYVIDEYPDN